MSAKELFSLKCENPAVAGQEHTWEVGQKVIYSSQMGESIVAITRITDGRGGTVYVGKEMFDASGQARGGGSWSTRSIHPLTEEKKNSIIGANVRAKLSGFNWNTLPDDVAKEAIALLRKSFPKMNFEKKEYI